MSIDRNSNIQSRRKCGYFNLTYFPILLSCLLPQSDEQRVVVFARGSLSVCCVLRCCCEKNEQLSSDMATIYEGGEREIERKAIFDLATSISVQNPKSGGVAVTPSVGFQVKTPSKSSAMTWVCYTGMHTCIDGYHIEQQHRRHNKNDPLSARCHHSAVLSSEMDTTLCGD